MFKEYGELSTKLYEITKPVGYSIDGDIEYYFSKLENLNGSILEAGVGTGRFLIPLIQNGLHVEGVDLSLEMIKQCKVNMNEHKVDTKVYQQDLTNLSLPNKYDAIIMPTGSFCLLPKDKVSQILTSFYNHLNIDGKIIIDLELPIDFKLGEVCSSSYSLTKEEGILFTSISEEIDWFAQKTSYIHKYELLNKGSIESTEVSHFTLFWYGITEFELLLKEVGFDNINYELGYGHDSQSSLITFIATR